MSFALLRRIGTVATGGLALLGCVTATYGPIGEGSGFGYSEVRNADGSYAVRVVAMSADQAHEFWDRRATELCGGSNFRKNIFRAQIPVVTTTGYASNPYNPGYGGSYTQDMYGPLIMEGYLHCEAPATTAEGAASAEVEAPARAADVPAADPPQGENPQR